MPMANYLGCFMPFRWRHDGDDLGDLALTRRILPHLIRSRTGAAVYYKQRVDAEALEAFITERRAQDPTRRLTTLHVMLWAITQTLHQRPRLNRFTAGGRIYQRRGIFISTSVKKGKTDDHPTIAVKYEMDHTWTLEEVYDLVEGVIVEGRSPAESPTDKELKLFFMLPHFLLYALTGLLRGADALGLLPAFFTKGDPFFASIFLTSLGSIRMESVYHHLYEYGNTPIFMIAGAIQPEVCPGADGTPEVRRQMTLRYTFDERIEDGLYCLKSLEIFKEILENPEAALAAHMSTSGPKV